MKAKQSTVSNTAPVAAAIRIATSAYGRAVPLVYGRTRVAPNLIWYGTFRSIAHTETQESGGKGGGGGVTQTTTTWTYETGVAMALGEGVISQVVKSWINKAVYEGSYGMTLFTGSYSQTAWSFLVTNYPGQDITYRGIAYVAHAAFPLGADPTMPQINFEVDGNQQNLLAYGKYDCDPKDIATDILTNAHYGAGFPTAAIGDLAAWSNFCRAAGVLISPAYIEQQPAQEIIQRLADMTNTGVYFSEGKFKARPYSDEAASGNGATYTPDNTPLYDLGPDDFQNKDDPIECARSNSTDAYNQLQLKCYDRTGWYIEAVVEAKDQANIEKYGLRTQQPLDYKEIVDTQVARTVAQHLLQRKLYVRNVYRFMLSPKYLLLEPTDLVTLTDTRLGLDHKLVRITTIDEDEGGGFSVEAEEVPTNVSAAALYATQSQGGYQIDFNADPGDVTTPVIFEPPIEFSRTGLAVGVAVSGANTNWGGAEIWVSYDNATYKKQGITYGGARYGALTANMSASQNAIASVQLAGKGGQINPGTTTAAENAETLCLIASEFSSFTSANLTGNNAYDLTMYERGQYATDAASHTTGDRFVRMDAGVVYSEPLDLAMIGETIYVKFTSFNIFAGGMQSLADVSAYPYTITGEMVALPPSSVSNFDAVADETGVLLTWDEIADHDRKDYVIRQGASWETGTQVAVIAATELRVRPLDATTYTWWIKARDQLLNESETATQKALVVTGPLVVFPTGVIDSNLYRLTWPAPAPEFPISHYEVRYGANWAAGTLVGTSKTTIFQKPAEWLGSRVFWVAAVDVHGNVGPAGSTEIIVTAASAPTVTAQVIDNNVLLYWTDVSGSLPILWWEVRRGATYGSSVLIGTKQGGFTTVLETTAGNYTYWVTGVDSAGNYGAHGSVAAEVSAPPDFQLNADLYSAFNGTFNSALLEFGSVVFPVNTTETWAEHFTNHSWNTPQDQINAGYEIYIEPSQNTGYYEEVIDYGTTLASSQITVVPTWQTVDGAPTLECDISVSNTSANGPWTDFNNTFSAFASNFRWVKNKVRAVSSGGDDIARMTALETLLAVRLKNDAGSASCNSGDANGTPVMFNVEFVDVTSITITPQATTAVIPVYAFSGDPYEDTFYVYLFNDVGSRVSGTVSWAAKGF